MFIKNRRLQVFLEVSHCQFFLPGSRGGGAMVGKWESGKVLAGGYVEAKVWEWELGSGATRGRMPRYGASRVARSRGSSDFSLDRNMTDLIALLKITITGKISLLFFHH